MTDPTPLRFGYTMSPNIYESSKMSDPMSPNIYESSKMSDPMSPNIYESSKMSDPTPLGSATCSARVHVG
jgi:hypothetical protein